MFAAKNELLTRPSGGYQISRSLRFRSSASAYLSRTPASAGSSQKMTISMWAKRGLLSSNNFDMMTSGASGSNDALRFTSGDILQLFFAGATYYAQTTAVFRDPSAWYHIVASIDTTQATAANRMVLYVNGVQQAIGSSAYPAQNYNITNLNKNVAQYIGYNTTGYYLDGYLADINFIDGQALTPSSFGAYDSNGVWQPAQYTGTYGTNGFYLKFADNSGATATTIGKDSSGNGNNWTPNNISVTAGTTYDSMIDSPTNYADGGNGRGNYAVLNPLDPTVLTLSNGNLDATYATNSDAYCTSTLRVSSGKWYWEYNITSVGGTYAIVGVSSSSATSLALGSTASTYGYISSTGNKYNAGTATAYGSTYTSGAVVAVALDMDNGRLFFGLVSGGTITWQASADPVAGTNAAFTSLSGSFAPAVNGRNNSNVSFNAGQRPFSASSLPSGFLALNTQNLPTPTIANGAQNMAAVTWTATNSTQNVNNSGGFQPDFLWTKSRSNAYSNFLVDAVRGVTKGLFTDTTGPETTSTAGSDIAAFTSTGFTAGASNISNNFANGITDVTWQWKAGGTGVTNTSGSITSTVSANTSAGFSVVTFTAPASGGFTVGHGLGVTPGMIIGKDRSNANSWAVWHQSLSNLAQSYLQLSSTIAAAANTTIWNNTAPTSSVISMGVGGIMNASANTVLYCFAAVAGYSAFGSYTGNGSTDGPFVYTGFRPRYIMVKNSSTGGVGYNWLVVDTSRQTYNNTSTDPALFPNLSDGESNGWGFDILSNGFKIRSSGVAINGSSNTIIYAAFAENPFKYSRAR